MSIFFTIFSLLCCVGLVVTSYHVFIEIKGLDDFLKKLNNNENTNSIIESNSKIVKKIEPTLNKSNNLINLKQGLKSK